MKRYHFMTIVVLGIVVMPVVADSIWFINGSQGYDSCVDTYLDYSLATTNYSTASVLRVRSVTTPLRDALVKFDNLVLPENAVVTGAQLRVYQNGMTLSGSATYQIWAMQKNWDVTTTTWNTTDGSTAWATAGALGSADRGNAAVSELTIASTTAGYITIDLPASLVQSWIETPASNYGIQIASVSNIAMYIFSNETASGVSYKPALYVTYDVVPEPMSLSLILLGTMFGFITKHRNMPM